MTEVPIGRIEGVVTDANGVTVTGRWLPISTDILDDRAPNFMAELQRLLVRAVTDLDFYFLTGRDRTNGNPVPPVTFWPFLDTLEATYAEQRALAVEWRRRFHAAWCALRYGVEDDVEDEA